jgi:hypothetical protein
MKYFLIASLSLLFISCSKNNSPGTPTSRDSTCQIISVKSVNGTDSNTTILTYTPDGKLSETENSLAGITTYTYSGNQIFITEANSGGFHDTTILNNFGYSTQISVFTNTPTSLVLSQFFTYTTDTVLSYSVMRAYPMVVPETINYQFTDGDLTSTSISGVTDHYTYYTDHFEQPADLYMYNQLVHYGAMSYTNKHLTKSYTGNSSSDEYTYTFDASGKILTLTDQYVNSQSSSGTATYYYTYACHL